MKRLILAVICISVILCGCAAETGKYVVIKPHDEAYHVSTDSSSLTVNGYLSLKNAILTFVNEHVAEGTIRTQSYSGDLDRDLEQAVKEICTGDPLGIYAVDYMTYDYSAILGHQEIHVHTVFLRSEDEISGIVSVSGVSEMENYIIESLRNYDPVLTMRATDIAGAEIEQKVIDCYQDHPEFSMERPEVSVQFFPENGTQRIIEINFSYLQDRETLLNCRDRMFEKIAEIADLYRSDISTELTVRRILQRLVRDGNVTSDVSGMNSSAYGPIVEMTGTGFAYAQAYCLLMEECNIPCTLISGRKNGTTHYWCLISADDCMAYIDPSLSVRNPESLMLGSKDLLDMGYHMDDENLYVYVP